MNKLKLSKIFFYPVKSMGGVSIKTSLITDRGLQYDRRWLLVDENNVFITQRVLPEMALLSTSIKDGMIQIKHKTKNIESISFPHKIDNGKELKIKIWNDSCTALHYDNALDNWLGKTLNINCKLVFMPDTTYRPVDKNYGNKNDVVSFADGFPFMVIGQSSLNDLNKRLKTPLPINRFRPNFVFTGGEPFEEDHLKKIKIGDVMFSFVKPCARCVITTTDQETSERNKEPLLTLSSYRKVNNKIMFGQNLIHQNLGKVTVGDEVIVLEKK